ncbi:MAG: hypothetical protein GWP45_02735 [Proteobacteria bacterium]|nr:hypothetical protein [Pseudomonadota bacterium]
MELFLEIVPPASLGDLLLQNLAGFGFGLTQKIADRSQRRKKKDFALPNTKNPMFTSGKRMLTRQKDEIAIGDSAAFRETEGGSV